jgi:hypothetical protein
MKYTRKFFNDWLTYEDDDIKSLYPSNLKELIILPLIIALTSLIGLGVFYIFSLILGTILNTLISFLECIV